MQIGGGVRVSDAFQAIVGFEPIAIWVKQFCVEISQAKRLHFATLKREIRNSRTGGRKAGRARADLSEAGGANGVATGQS